MRIRIRNDQLRKALKSFKWACLIRESWLLESGGVRILASEKEIRLEVISDSLQACYILAVENMQEALEAGVHIYRSGTATVDLDTLTRLSAVVPPDYDILLESTVNRMRRPIRFPGIIPLAVTTDIRVIDPEDNQCMSGMIEGWPNNRSSAMPDITSSTLATTGPELTSAVQGLLSPTRSERKSQSLILDQYQGQLHICLFDGGRLASAMLPADGSLSDMFSVNGELFLTALRACARPKNITIGLSGDRLTMVVRTANTVLCLPIEEDPDIATLPELARRLDRSATGLVRVDGEQIKNHAALAKKHKCEILGMNLERRKLEIVSRCDSESHVRDHRSVASCKYHSSGLVTGSISLRVSQLIQALGGRKPGEIRLGLVPGGEMLRLSRSDAPLVNHYLKRLPEQNVEAERSQ